MKARTWLATATAGALAISFGLFGAGAITSAEATTSSPSSGDVVLSTGTTGQVTFQDASGVTLTQNLTTKDKTQCDLATTDSSLISFLPAGIGALAGTAVGYQPGTNGGSIGVETAKATSGTSCTQVNFGSTSSYEALTIKLNGAALLASADKLTFTRAQFDIEAKSNLVLEATFSLGGVPVSFTTADGLTTAQSTTLYTGKSQLKTTPDGVTQQNCNVTTSADSGPDSGSSDNCKWVVVPDSPFDTVTLTPKTGAFSLEGGGDWGTDAGSHRTLFHVLSNAEGELNCDTARVATQPGAGGTITNVGITRLVNGAIDPTTKLPVACVALPYSLDTTAGEATFHKPLTTGQETAQFAMKIDRTFATPSNPLDPVQVDWEDGGLPQNVPFCVAGLIKSIDSNNLPTVDFSKVIASLDQSTTTTTTTPKTLTQYACVYKQAVTIGSDGSATANDWVYFTGDIKFPVA